MTCTARKPLFHDLTGSHESYDSSQAIDESYLFDSIGQGCAHSMKRENMVVKR